MNFSPIPGLAEAALRLHKKSQSNGSGLFQLHPVRNVSYPEAEHSSGTHLDSGRSWGSGVGWNERLTGGGRMTESLIL